MPRCLRLPATGLFLALGLLLSACDPKPAANASAAATPAPSSSSASPRGAGASPAGIKPADSGDKVDESSAHKGPSEGGAAVGGMSGPNGAAK